MACQQKLIPNESTPPTLKDRGPRRTARDPRSLGSPLRASVIWIGLSNPRFLVLGP
jgi:hypothetical protein